MLAVFGTPRITFSPRTGPGPRCNPSVAGFSLIASQLGE
jgi:hypothetical protein